MTDAAAVTPAEKNNVRVILNVAWMAILLGVTMQLLLLIFSGLPAMADFVTDMTQKIAWATIVCVGVSVGTAAARTLPAAGGIAGFIAAPLAFIIAKTLHKSLGAAIGAMPAPEPALALLIALIAIKAVEYLLFGYALSLLLKAQSRYARFALAGAIAGIATAGALAGALAIWAAKMPPAGKLAAQMTNEVIFPVGCATVLFAANFLAAKAK